MAGGFDLADAAVRFADVWKGFGGPAVLRGLDLEVPRSATLTVMGGSGSGKTVLLRLAAGLLKPDRGRITLLGAETVPLREEALLPLRCRLGFVFQGAALFDSLTAFENVKIGIESRQRSGPVGAMLRLPYNRREEREGDARALELLDFVGLRSRANELAASLNAVPVIKFVCHAAFASISMFRLSAEILPQFVLCLFKCPFLLVRQLFAGAIDVESQHRHRRTIRARLAAMALLGRALDGICDLFRVAGGEDAFPQVHGVAVFGDLLRPFLPGHDETP